jgi:hypothetical protein
MMLRSDSQLASTDANRAFSSALANRQAMAQDAKPSTAAPNATHIHPTLEVRRLISDSGRYVSGARFAIPHSGLPCLFITRGAGDGKSDTIIMLHSASNTRASGAVPQQLSKIPTCVTRPKLSERVELRKNRGRFEEHLRFTMRRDCSVVARPETSPR